MQIKMIQFSFSNNFLFRVNITGEKVERNISTIRDALQTYRSVYRMIYYMSEYWSKCELCVLIGYLSGWDGPILPARNFPRLVPPVQKSSLFLPYCQSVIYQACSGTDWVANFLYSTYNSQPFCHGVNLSAILSVLLFICVTQCICRSSTKGIQSSKLGV